MSEVNAMTDETLNLNSNFCIKDLISWSFQVARGMEYLTQKKVILHYVFNSERTIKEYIFRFFMAIWQPGTFC